jgi:DNA-binding beta-propeller fold protein YncE
MRRIFASRLLALAVATFSMSMTAQSAPDYKPTKTWKLGGEGGWDYLTMDPDGRRLFIARATRVMVVDADSGKLIAEIPDTPGVHGVALVPELGRGFISVGGADSVAIFDTKSLKVLNKVKVGTRPDAIVYEPFTKRVFTFNAASKDTTALDAAKGEVVGKIDLGGKPEFAASDAKGTMFVNIEDTGEIVAFDPQKLTVKSRWKLAGCEEPTGLALDKENRRLFAACGGNKKMAIVDADTGKMITMPDIGEGSDAAAFDADQKLAFASAGDGTITVIREESPDKFSVVETVKTQDRARTMTLDPKTHELFTVTAKVLPERKIVPDTFVVLVVEKSR